MFALTTLGINMGANEVIKATLQRSILLNRFDFKSYKYL